MPKGPVAEVASAAGSRFTPTECRGYGRSFTKSFKKVGSRPRYPDECAEHRREGDIAVTIDWLTGKLEAIGNQWL